MAFEEQLDLSSPIHEIRTESLKHFESNGFPTKIRFELIVLCIELVSSKIILFCMGTEPE